MIVAIGVGLPQPGKPTFADAILDRLVHNAYRLELEGQSFRKSAAKTGDETREE